MDPKGYFLIGIDRDKKIIRVGYCRIVKLKNTSRNDMVAEFSPVLVEVLWGDVEAASVLAEAGQHHQESSTSCEAPGRRREHGAGRRSAGTASSGVGCAPLARAV